MNALLEALKNGRCPHAILLSGYDAEALQRTAEQAAGILLCTGDNKPCGSCKSCELLQAGTHPDLITLTDPKSIKIEPVRALIEQVQVTPRYGKRAVIIENAHLMTVQAQNALLKTLEEPPEGTVFLLTGAEAGLLPTIRSRCMIIRTGSAAASISRETAEVVDRICRTGPFAQQGYYKAITDVPDKQKPAARLAFANELEMQAMEFARLAALNSPNTGYYLECALALIAARKRVPNGNLNMVIDKLMIDIKRARLKKRVPHSDITG